MPTQLYADFGLKIEGARKFNRPDSPNSYQTDSGTVTKDSLWPEPPTDKRNLFRNFIIHKFRDCIRSSLKTDDPALIDEYVSQVLALKSLFENTRTADEAINLIRQLDYQRDSLGKPIFNKKLIFTRHVKFWELTESQMRLEGFGLTPQEKALNEIKEYVQSFIINDSFTVRPKSLEFTIRNQSYTFPLDPNVQPEEPVIGKLVIVDNGVVVGLNQSLENYNRLLEEHLKKQCKTRKKKPNRIKKPYLNSVRHTGSDYRHGKDIYPEELRKRFAFYGGQFGNWLTQAERVQAVNYAFDAFSDLAFILNIRETEISFNHELGIAFGARGRGRGRAHYEPEYHVINLTKLKGAGALAHEWFHSLDHHLAELYGDSSCLFSSQKQDSIPGLKALVERVGDGKFEYTKESLLLDSFEGRKKPYWSDPSEMIARAFNTYIIDRLRAEGIVNDFLCYEFDISINLDNKHRVCANPHGESREELNTLFDAFFDELNSKGILQSRTDGSSSSDNKITYHFVGPSGKNS